jgi:hypothetical protein
MWCQNNEEHKAYVADIKALRELSESTVRHYKALTILLNTSTRLSMSDDTFRNFVNVIARTALFPEPVSKMETGPKEVISEKAVPKESASIKYLLQEFEKKLDKEIVKKLKGKPFLYTTIFQTDHNTGWPFLLLTTVDIVNIPNAGPTTDNYHSVKLQILPFESDLIHVTMNGKETQSFVWNINGKTIEALAENISKFLWPEFVD